MRDGRPSSIAEILRLRRETFRLSQDELGWIARVSRNTVSNLERGQVESQITTVRDLATALGLSSGSFNPFLNGETDHLFELMDSRALKRVFEILGEIRGNDHAQAREAADSFFRFMAMRQDMVSLPEILLNGSFDSDLNSARDNFIGDFVDWVDQDQSDPLVEWFRDQGWSPEDIALAKRRRTDTLVTSLAVGDTIAHQSYGMGTVVSLEGAKAATVKFIEFGLKTLHIAYAPIMKLDPSLTLPKDSQPSDLSPEENSDSSRAFNRLPLRVQDALTSGDVIDAEITPLDASPGYSIVTLVVRDTEASRDSAHRRHVIDMLQRWRDALAGTTKPMLRIDLERLLQLPKNEVAQLARYIAVLQSQRNDYSMRPVPLYEPDLRLLAVIHEKPVPDLIQMFNAWGVVTSESPRVGA